MEKEHNSNINKNAIGSVNGIHTNLVSMKFRWLKGGGVDHVIIKDCPPKERLCWTCGKVDHNKQECPVSDTETKAFDEKLKQEIKN